MPGYLIRRPTDTDRAKISYDIGCILINGDDADDALANAKEKISSICSPNEAANLDDWTVTPNAGGSLTFEVDIHNDGTPGSLTFNLDGVLVATLSIAATAAQIAAAFEDDLPANSYVSVSIGLGTGGTENDYLWQVRFQGAAANTPFALTMGTGSLSGSDSASLEITEYGHEPAEWPDELNGAVFVGDMYVPGNRLRGAGPVVS